MWKDYFPAVDAIVFLIDAWDRQRFNESITELDSLLADEQLLNCPVLILGNKIDKIGAAGEQEIRNTFNLHGKTTGKVNSNLFYHSFKIALTKILFYFSLTLHVTNFNSGQWNYLCAASNREKDTERFVFNLSIKFHFHFLICVFFQIY